ncbi:MAG TPA: hypothetical protein VGD45_09740 [Steroidobacter sp.]|uniref:hypothetical protein n=1 Tax=Steroidobacter sp. TaxID=1978227 RepID=UPI002EDAF4C1
MELDLPAELTQALEREAADAGRTLHAHIVSKLEGITPPLEMIDAKALKRGLTKLTAFLNRIPTVKVMSSEVTKDAYWWVKLSIDLDHRLAWSVVQELGYVLNYLSVSERLPTVFMPVSPPVYLNGGPREFLAWVIESKFNYIDPADIAEALEGRLPQPVDDQSQWRSDQDV